MDKNSEEYKKWLFECFKAYDEHRDGPHLHEGQDFAIKTTPDTTC